MKCCDMSAGKLREPVTFQRMTRTSDGAGGQTQSWGDIAGTPSRAYVTPVSGSERYSFDRTQAIVRIKIVTRYNSDIKETDRVIIRGRAHNIRFVNNLEFQDKWLEIMVENGVAI